MFFAYIMIKLVVRQNDKMTRLTDSPLIWFQRLTAKLWLHVMVTTAACGTIGCVLADTCVTGELDRNFMIIQTSSCTVVNIFGDCERRGDMRTYRPGVTLILVFTVKCSEPASLA